MIAMVSALAALYGLSAIHRKTAYIGFAIVALWGLAAVIYQMRKQYDRDQNEKRREETKKQINELLAEGQRLAVSIKARNPNHETVLSKKSARRLGRLQPDLGLE